MLILISWDCVWFFCYFIIVFKFKDEKQRALISTKTEDNSCLCFSLKCSKSRYRISDGTGYLSFISWAILHSKESSAVPSTAHLDNGSCTSSVILQDTESSTSLTVWMHSKEHLPSKCKGTRLCWRNPSHMLLSSPLVYATCWSVGKALPPALVTELCSSAQRPPRNRGGISTAPAKTLSEDTIRCPAQILLTCVLQGP